MGIKTRKKGIQYARLATASYCQRWLWQFEDRLYLSIPIVSSFHKTKLIFNCFFPRIWFSMEWCASISKSLVRRLLRNAFGSPVQPLRKTLYWLSSRSSGQTWGCYPNQSIHYTKYIRGKVWIFIVLNIYIHIFCILFLYAIFIRILESQIQKPCPS